MTFDHFRAKDLKNHFKGHLATKQKHIFTLLKLCLGDDLGLGLMRLKSRKIQLLRLKG